MNGQTTSAKGRFPVKQPSHRPLVTTLALLTALFLSASAQTQLQPFSNPETPRYDAATFVQIGSASPIAYHWSGNGFYFVSSASGASQIYRLTAQGWPYQLTAFDDGVAFMSLSYGGDKAIVGTAIGGSEQAQLFLMDTETGGLQQLTNTPAIQFGSVRWGRDDRSIFYRANADNRRDFFIYRMDLASGASERVFGDTLALRGSNDIEDLSQDGGKLVITHYRTNVYNDLYLLDLTTGKYQKLTADSVSAAYHGVTLMPDNRSLWLVCNGNTDGIARLAKMKVGSTAVEYPPDGWIDPRWEIEGIWVSQDYRWMAVMGNENGYYRLKLREIETAEELPSPPLNGSISSVMFDKSGSIVFRFDGPTRTGDVWRWNPVSRQLTQLTFSSYAGIDQTLFVEPELITYRSFDSLEIPAFQYVPRGYVKGTPIPFVIIAHGGPEGQSRPTFSRWTQMLLYNGYGVLAPNVRGSTGYGRQFEEMDNYKNRKKSLMDYKAAAEYLVANGLTKSGMMAIDGGSYGGYVVYGMITEYPDLLSAAMASVGIANFQTFLENTAPYRRALRESEYGPLSDPEFLKEISPIWKADRIKTPLLVIHGANDPRVPIGEARQMIAAIQKNGGVVDSLIFADEGHGASKRSNQIPEFRKSLEFLNKYLHRSQ